MKKIFIISIITALLLFGCGNNGEVVNVTGNIEIEPETEQISYPPEKPSFESEIIVSESEESQEELKKQEEEIKKQEELKKQEEETKRQEELKKQEEETKRQEELKKQEEETKRQEELKKQEEEIKKQEELKKQEEEVKKQEELKKQEEEIKRQEEEMKKQEELKQQQVVAKSKGEPDEVKAVWVSYLEFLTLAKGQSERGFSANMDYLFKEISDFGLNTVFVQVRPFGDAMYPSKYFPWSYYLTGTEGVDPGYDPLQIMVDKAKKYGVKIEAWINPYRVRVPGSPTPISEDNIVNKYIRNGSDAVIQYNGGTYYNPASQEARNLIIAGVIEIIENYDIDGIHLDDYFYPTVDLAFDKMNYDIYKNNGGTLSQADWRRENVNTLISQLYSSIKQTDDSVRFGISPQARMDVNYNAEFADVEKWLSEDGYVDYITPQIYFGFEHGTVPYDETVEIWNNMAQKADKDIYVGLAAYKAGRPDYGAKQGKDEWVQSNSVLADMITAARRYPQYKGFALYRFDSLFRPETLLKSHMEAERENLSKVL